MKKRTFRDTLNLIFVGKRYSKLKNINEQVRYLIMNYIFMIASVPLIILGLTLIGVNKITAVSDFSLAALLIASLFLMRSKVPLKAIPLVMVPLFGFYCLYLLYKGDYNLWTAVWMFTFPLFAIFLCQMTMGLIQSFIVLAAAAFILYAPISPAHSIIIPQIKFRFIISYVLLLALTLIYERISMLKDQKEAALNKELAQERDIIQTMKDNIHQGIFLMDAELKILPQYSRPLISILSYYDSELSGKNFLDILSASLDAKQLQTMKGYFSMMFSKSKSAKVLESANPISEFIYKVDDRLKTLSTKFQLIEQTGLEPFVIGIVQDITREKEFEKELQAQREAQELEMKNMFDVIQIDPLVFQDFIDDTEANFNYINSILRDKSLTERQVVTKFFQNVHAIKSNALILGLETFGKKLHALEDEIKAVAGYNEVHVEDILGLAVKLEQIMQEKDSYIKMVKKIESFKTSNQIDSVIVHSLTKAVEKISAETKKKVEFKAGQLDIGILESKLRKPIKDILFQCVRNSIYHGIESEEERLKKNKHPQGLLVVSIKNVDGNAEITYSDDGRGLDWEKIKSKYLELHPGSEDVTNKQLLASIFSPEFSTSEETTMVAGRGVGLSLVKDIVKENKGSINVNSSDAGLTFKFTLPIPA